MSETQEPVESFDHPLMVSEAGRVMPRTTWVHIKDGIVKRVAHVYSVLVHPFEDLGEDIYVGHNDMSRMTVPMRGDAVIPGREGMVFPGMLVDTKGNFTPTEGRTGPLHPTEPAYLAGPGAMTGDFGGSRKDTDEALKASQERTEAHAKAEEEMAEKHEQEPHDPAEHVVLDQHVVPVTSESVHEEEHGEETSASSESKPKSE